MNDLYSYISGIKNPNTRQVVAELLRRIASIDGSVSKLRLKQMLDKPYGQQLLSAVVADLAQIYSKNIGREEKRVGDIWVDKLHYVELDPPVGNGAGIPAGYKLLGNEKAPYNPELTEYGGTVTQFLPLQLFFDPNAEIITEELRFKTPVPTAGFAIVDHFDGEVTMYGGVTGIHPNHIGLNHTWSIIPDTVDCNIVERDKYGTVAHKLTITDSGDKAADVDGWYIEGASQANTDWNELTRKGTLYGSIYKIIPDVIIELYKDFDRTELVLRGQGLGIDPIELLEENGSGLSGEVQATHTVDGFFEVQIFWDSEELEARFGMAYASMKLDWNEDLGVYNTRSYVAGGTAWDGSPSASKTVYEFNPHAQPDALDPEVTPYWKRLKDLPQSLEDGVGGIVRGENDNQYFCCGGGDWTDGKFRYYDGRHWQLIDESIPEAGLRHYATSASLDGRMYVFGGSNLTTDEFATTVCYLESYGKTPPYTWQWVEVAPFPTFGRAYLSSYANENDGTITVGLGYNPLVGGQCQDFWKYSVPEDTYSPMCPLPGAGRANARGITAHQYHSPDSATTISIVGGGDNLEIGLRYSDWFREHLLTVQRIL